ncbi:MAG: hypothetical protein ACREJ3_15625, partial [Polyangiaceae bacterium]
PSDAVWVASDYLSSAAGALTLAEGTKAPTFGVDLGGDPELAVSRGRAFFIARDQDLIFEVDPACGTLKPAVRAHVESSNGTSDPQDVAVASDGSLWVPLYNVPALLVLGPDGSVRRTIDLSSYDNDGNPEASAIAIVDTPGGEKAFVALQRLSPAFRSEQPSWMLRVDVATGVVEAHVELAGRNPFGMVQQGPLLWLAEPGNFDSAVEPLAGVERFDTSTSTTSLLAREIDLGGSVAEIAVSGRCGAAIIADATSENATSLVTFDGSSGRVIAPASSSPLATAGFDLQGLTWAEGLLLAGDRRRVASGYPVHVFDVASACALSARPDSVFLPLPPVAVR